MNARLRPIDDTAVIEAVANEAQDIAHLSADYRQAQGWRKESLLTTLMQKLDGLLDTMMGNFGGHVTIAEATDLMREHHPLTESRLARLPRRAVPLVVIRELVAIHQMPVKRDRLQNWIGFADCYRHAIV